MTVNPPYLCSLAILFAVGAFSQRIQFDDSFNKKWSVVSGRMQQPTCVKIPENMTMCQQIGYDTMRLPNLLDHDNLEEVISQAKNWSPLIGIRCATNTRIFLCSLFTPVCLERIIYPCRSLCESVQDGCVGYMKKYGFPWPEMLRCDKFPQDDSMCIPAVTEDPDAKQELVCKPCKEPDTMEGILHSYCSNHFVLRAKIRSLKRDPADLGDVEIEMGRSKKKFYKKDSSLPKKVWKELASPDVRIYISQALGCSCGRRIMERENHLMSIRVEKKYDSTGEEVMRYYAEFITPWGENNSGTKPSVKKALRTIRRAEDGDDSNSLCQGGLPTLESYRISDSEPSRRRSRSRRKHKL